jgi:hypothetical protein
MNRPLTKISVEKKRKAIGMPVMVTLSLLIFLVGCDKPKEHPTPKPANVVILSKTVKKDTARTMRLMGVKLYPKSYWIEGEVKNMGDIDAQDIYISFTLKNVKGFKIISARLDHLPAGETMEFSTDTAETKLAFYLPQNSKPLVTFK